MKGDTKPAPAAKPAKPVIPVVPAEIEATIRGAFDLGDAAKLLRRDHPQLDQAQRLQAIKDVCTKINTKINAERDRPNARREAIGRMARQHGGEPHKENR